MEFTTEYVSNDFLHLNSCGIEYHGDVDIGRVREHGRRDYHILYIHSGVCCAEIDGEDTEVGDGGLILFRPGIKHKYSYKAKDKTTVGFLHFTGKSCEELTCRLFGYDKSLVYIGKSHRIREIFEKTAKEYILKKYGWEDMCKAYLMKFFATAIRRRNIKSEGRIKIIDDACLYMNEHYNENFSLRDYADFCHMSTGRFAHVFKETVGIAPMDYIMNLKISTAKELLLSSDMRIGDIADFLGFGTQNYFSRIFKIKVGMSPINFVKYN